MVCQCLLILGSFYYLIYPQHFCAQTGKLREGTNEDMSIAKAIAIVMDRNPQLRFVLIYFLPLFTVQHKHTSHFNSGFSMYSLQARRDCSWSSSVVFVPYGGLVCHWRRFNFTTGLWSGMFLFLTIWPVYLHIVKLLCLMHDNVDGMQEVLLPGGHGLMVRGYRPVINTLAKGLDIRLNHKYA